MQRPRSFPGKQGRQESGPQRAMHGRRALDQSSMAPLLQQGIPGRMRRYGRARGLEIGVKTAPDIPNEATAMGPLGVGRIAFAHPGSGCTQRLVKRGVPQRKLDPAKTSLTPSQESTPVTATPQKVYSGKQQGVNFFTACRKDALMVRAHPR